jgi:hypothetical protein
MNAFTTIAALTGVQAAGIIYGTDVFCALVQRPALAQLGDATMAAAIGCGLRRARRRPWCCWPPPRSYSPDYVARLE